MSTEREAGEALACPECGAPMQLLPSKHGLFYTCTAWRATGCKGTHGAHPDGSPLGFPANAATKRARIEAHAAFDTLWQGGRMSRRAAYRWMQEAMGLAKEDAHIGKFAADQCTELIRLIAFAAHAPDKAAVETL